MQHDFGRGLTQKEATKDARGRLAMQIRAQVKTERFLDRAVGEGRLGVMMRTKTTVVAEEVLEYGRLGESHHVKGCGWHVRFELDLRPEDVAAAQMLRAGRETGVPLRWEGPEWLVKSRLLARIEAHLGPERETLGPLPVAFAPARTGTGWVLSIDGQHVLLDPRNITWAVEAKTSRDDCVLRWAREKASRAGPLTDGERFKLRWRCGLPAACAVFNLRADGHYTLLDETRSHRDITEWPQLPEGAKSAWFHAEATPKTLFNQAPLEWYMVACKPGLEVPHTCRAPRSGNTSRIPGCGIAALLRWLEHVNPSLVRVLPVSIRAR